MTKIAELVTTIYGNVETMDLNTQSDIGLKFFNTENYVQWS